MTCKRPKVSSVAKADGSNENTSAGQNSAPYQRVGPSSRGSKRTATEGVQYNEQVAGPAVRASKVKAVEVRCHPPSCGNVWLCLI